MDSSFYDEERVALQAMQMHRDNRKFVPSMALEDVIPPQRFAKVRYTINSREAREMCLEFTILAVVLGIAIVAICVDIAERPASCGISIREWVLAALCIWLAWRGISLLRIAAL